MLGSVAETNRLHSVCDEVVGALVGGQLVVAETNRLHSVCDEIGEAYDPFGHRCRNEPSALGV